MIGDCCIRPRSVRKSDELACGPNNKPKIEEIRVYCLSTLTEVYSRTVNNNCRVGYISQFVNTDPVCTPVPMAIVDVYNPDEVDELMRYSLDRDSDTYNNEYLLSPIKIKALNPDHECFLDSIKRGRRVGLIYKINRPGGAYQWRRFVGELSDADGGLIGGYDFTFSAVNPKRMDRPMWINLGTEEATDTGIDALTDFDGSGGCYGLAFNKTYTGVMSKIVVVGHSLPADASKIFVHENGQLLDPDDDERGYSVSGNEIILDDASSEATYQVLIYE